MSCNFKTIICVILIVNFVNTDGTILGNFLRACRPPATMKSFDLNKINGTWFVYKYSLNSILEDYACQKTDYIVTDEKTVDGETVVISDSVAWSKKSDWIDYRMINYYDTGRSGILSMAPRVYKMIISDFLWNHTNYYIIDTNYDDFLIGYYCTSKYFGLYTLENFYVLARRKNVDEKIFQSNLHNALSLFVPQTFMLNKVNHDEAKCSRKKSSTQKKSILII